MEKGVTFDEKHSTEFGLKLINIYIPMPSPKINVIQIPGSDGTLDLTEISGRPVYENREGLEMTFTLLNKDYYDWFQAYSEIAQYIQGRKVKLVLDDDPNYYYICRLNIDGKKSNPSLAEITISGTADPFKYDIISSMDDWLWDPFDFSTGIIRTIKDVKITQSYHMIRIPEAGASAVPIFIVTEMTSPMTVSDGNRTFELAVGKNRFPEIRLGKKEVTLTFTGEGTLTIDYRGRYL